MVAGSLNGPGGASAGGPTDDTRATSAQFTFTEEEDSADFFIPYVWAILRRHPPFRAPPVAGLASITGVISGGGGASAGFLFL